MQPDFWTSSNPCRLRMGVSSLRPIPILMRGYALISYFGAFSLSSFSTRPTSSAAMPRSTRWAGRFPRVTAFDQNVFDLTPNRIAAMSLKSIRLGLILWLIVQPASFILMTMLRDW